MTPLDVPTGRFHRPVGGRTVIAMTKQAHLIADGRVLCPQAGRDVDFERCLGCPLLVDLDVDSRHPTVICRPSVKAEAWMLRA